MLFFFEKKNQKTFARLGVARWGQERGRAWLGRAGRRVLGVGFVRVPDQDVAVVVQQFGGRLHSQSALAFIAVGLFWHPHLSPELVTRHLQALACDCTNAATSGRNRMVKAPRMMEPWQR